MKIYTKKFVIILSFFLIAFNMYQIESRASEKKTDNFILNVGYFEFSGLTYTDDNGKPAGLVNEITMKTLENANIKYKIKSYPPSRFYHELTEGRVHLFNGLSAIPAVKKSCVSSEITLFPLEMRVYWTGDKKPVKVKEDLIGHSVVIVKGFTYKDWGAWIRSGKNDIEFFDTYTHDSAFRMLKKGRGEYLLNYKYIDSKYIEKEQFKNLTAKTLFKWNCYFNVQKNTPDAQELLKRIEASYLQLIEQGKLKKFE
ncbi:transporter substrate-binding domain-containing protein [Desulfobacterales bacterium HSG17]|nr:transporter substrate-binding domain-containing protein [Desulfobacterales bacterium HSG17]